ncbi:hypothetical protein [Peptostreptococcus equinus]|uniref:DUF1292 domain-containing protein n=1 Tax=Peptostreptococcus equinus TaxID=3003601 RepID=A0ABY7JPZ9_9FIRM|nr:hypothetical protein [Peptostreptococcus sp. CBA3647]WAW15229.1 hypothetical protein O0R46_01910 [Peptostreptococcus sp. CBA3647]
MENLGSEFVVNEFNLSGYKIGTFIFNYREMPVDNGSDAFVEIDVYKLSEPVILYVKTFKAPLIEESTPVSLCEALYEEFYLATEDEN